MQPDDMKQVFSLRACAPPGGYLRVRLQGKVQQQWEDAQLYIAIRCGQGMALVCKGSLLPRHWVHAATCFGALVSSCPALCLLCWLPRQLVYVRHVITLEPI